MTIIAKNFIPAVSAANKETMTLGKICFVTTTRADWGLLMPVADILRRTEGVEVSVVASNMHLSERFGMTAGEIEAAGFTIDARVPMDDEGDDEASRVRAAAQCMAGMADAFSRIAPDALVILGDRYEMLAVASAAAIMHIPVVHIAGGAVSEGAVDDSMRHAITKLASLHLTETEEYRRRVIQMGEAPDTVVDTGAIGVWNALNITPLPKTALEDFLGMNLDGDVAVVTYHPATNDVSSTPAGQVSAMLEALDAFPALKCVITYPNNDAGGASIIPLLEAYTSARPDRVRLVPSLGMLRYQSLLKVASVVIGNSSSGIVEVPSAGIPTVDIGIRQRGRIAAPSVVHCGNGAADIRAAIALALSDAVRSLAAKCENPYYKPDTPVIMRNAIMRFMASKPLSPKKFHNIPFEL